MSIVRKTVSAKELISDRGLIVAQVLKIAKTHALTFSGKVARLQELARDSLIEEESKKHTKKAVHFAEKEAYNQESAESTQIVDFETDMLQEAAETILAMTPFVTPSLDENDLYLLIGSAVEPL